MAAPVEIRLTKQYRTASGKSVNLITCVSRSHEGYPVAGVIYENGKYTTYFWTDDGMSMSGETYDLVEGSGE